MSIRLDIPKAAVEVSRGVDIRALGYPDSGGIHRALVATGINSNL